MASKKPFQKNHLPFLGVLILFSAFSLYALTSFFVSNDNRIDRLYTSTLNSVAVDVPAECQTCPPFPVCAPLCEAAADISAPPECQTCPPFPVCDAVCADVKPYEIFSDVMSDHPNGRAIEALLVNGVINGYADGRFKPSNNINRAELLTILTTATSADISGSLVNCFTDVGTDWYAPFVCYAKRAGWVSGYADGSYKPGNNVIRAEALRIVLGALNYDVPASISDAPYPDVPAKEWYAPYVKVAKDVGIFVSGNSFNPSANLNRAEFVQMVYDAMYYKGLL